MEGYAKFLEFDWSDERWRTYLNGLYPPPEQEQIAKFKKKWYKKNVDSSFDESYEPPSSSTTAEKMQEPSLSLPKGIYDDGSRWSELGQKTSICCFAYTASLFLAVGALVGVFPAYQSLVLLVGSFILEVIAKYGVKFNREYMQHILLDDVGIMPIMAVTLLVPGLHANVRRLAVGPLFCTAVLSFAQLCKFNGRLPAAARDFWAPLTSRKARKAVMRLRAHLELLLGFSMMIGVLLMACAPISTLLFWNFMMMRYMMSDFTQASFKDMDDTLRPILESVPGVKQGYQALKRWLYGFVDPESKTAGQLCTIL